MRSILSLVPKSKPTTTIFMTQICSFNSTLSSSKPHGKLQIQLQQSKNHHSSMPFSRHVLYPQTKKSKKSQINQPNYQKQHKIKSSRTNLSKSKNSNNAINRNKTHIHTHQYSRKTRPFSYFKHFISTDNLYKYICTTIYICIYW